MNKDVLQAKQETVSEIVNKVKSSSSVIVCEYRGLTVAQTQALRRALAQEKATMNVYKNSLVERAAEELGYQDMKQLLSGPNAFFFSEDVSSGAKVIAKYAKRYGDSHTIKGGMFEGQFADQAKVAEIAIKVLNEEKSYLFRYGGEEFAFFLLNPTKEKLFDIAMKIKNEVYNANITRNDTQYGRITITLGCSLEETVRRNDAEYVLNADKELYVGKNNQKNCVVLDDEIHR